MGISCLSHGYLMVVPFGAHATVAAASCSRRRRGGGCANAGACAATLRQRRCIAGATLALGGVGVEPSWAAFGANAVDRGHGPWRRCASAGGWRQRPAPWRQRWHCRLPSFTHCLVVLHGNMWFCPLASRWRCWARCCCLNSWSYLPSYFPR